jgi:hypothetical protein
LEKRRELYLGARTEDGGGGKGGRTTRDKQGKLCLYLKSTHTDTENTTVNQILSTSKLAS